MRKLFRCKQRQCLSYHEGIFHFVISLHVVAFHVTGNVVDRVYRQSEILALFWPHVEVILTVTATYVRRL
jgi:hypothetical protein